MRNRLFTLILIALLALPALAVVPFAGAQEAVYFPTTEWRTSTPEEQGMDSAQLVAALDYVAANELPIDSITVIRHGYVVLDAYYAPYTADLEHHLWSATEGFISTLVGIAVDQGRIAGLDQPLLALFPDRTIANVTDNKEALTIGDLLAMSSGVSCGYETPSILQAPDALGYLLDLKVELQPGSQFTYCALNSDLLSGAVEAAAGMPLLDYANQVLFNPLGISGYQWQTLPNGLPYGQLGLHLTPHDMARLGYLYLQGGQWAGQQVVSSDWVSTVTCAGPAPCLDYIESLSTQAGGSRFGFGYDWWTYPGFYLTGIGVPGGQLIAVAPAQDMVVVLTSRTKPFQQDAGSIPTELIGNLILGAASAEEPLPANPDALAALQARVDALGNPQPLAVEPLQEKAAEISGVNFALSPSIHLWFLDPALGEYLHGWPLQIDAFTLSFDQPDEATLALEFSDGYTIALAVGLDGLYRITDTRLGPLAMTGQWSPNGKGFSMTLEFVGTGEQRQISYGAMGKKILFICEDQATGYSPAQPASNAQPRE
jgi:CubicO group peptidase (beta-lactamase class C family)